MLGPVAMMGASIGLIDVGIPSLALHAGSRASSGVLLALWSVGSLSAGSGTAASPGEPACRTATGGC